MKPTALLTCLGLACSATYVSAQILSADRTTVWHPGVPGGVPDRTTVCAIVNASTYGNGADASSGIQAAVNACPVGQVVQLSAGTFTVNNYILINKGITLRGAGPTATVLQKTNGAIAGVDHGATDNQPIVVVGPNRWPKPNDATSQNLIANGARGAMSVAVANSAGFAAGQFVLVDANRVQRRRLDQPAHSQRRTHERHNLGVRPRRVQCGTTPPTRSSTIRFRAR